MIEITEARVERGGRAALDCVSLTLEPGEVLAVAGENGSGKSTLARLAAGALLAAAGSVSVDGVDPAAGVSERAEVRRLVGLVPQDPADAIVSPRVFDEIAFGPRNLRCSEEEVADRVEASLAAVDLTGTRDRLVAELSGGELVRVALAGALAMRPRYLVLDEVGAMLDGALRGEVRALARRLAKESGLGILMVTHDPIDIARADRVAVLRAGRVAWSGSPQDLMGYEEGLWRQVVGEGLLAATVRAGVLGGGSRHPGGSAALSRGASLAADSPAAPAGPSLVIAGVSHRYPGAGRQVLTQVDLTVQPGEVLLLSGPSGSGKSTLAAIVCGLMVPERGTASLDGEPVHASQVGFSSQRPESQLFLDRVHDELAFGPRAIGFSAQEVEARVGAAAQAFGIDEATLDRHPLELSGGWQRRVGLAAVRALGPAAYVFDEPTAGLDAQGRAEVHRLAIDLARAGAPVLVISHDVDEWLEHAGSVALIREGELVWQGSVSTLADHPEVWARAGLDQPVALGGAFDGRALSGSSADTIPISSAPARGAAPTGSVHDPAAEATDPSRPLDARVKIALFLAAAVTAFLVPPLVAVAVGALALLATAVAAGPCRVAHRPPLVPIALLAALVLLANLVTLDGSGTVPLIGSVGLNPSAGLAAVAALARLGILLGLALALAGTTTAPELSDALVRLLSPLARLGAPVGALGAALSIALTSIPAVSEEFRRIADAQRVRGARFDDGPLTERIGLRAAILIPLVSALLARADHLGEAMAARAFAPDVIQVPARELTRRDIVALMAGLGACALALAITFMTR